MKRCSLVTLVVVSFLGVLLAIAFLQADLSSDAEPTSLEAVVASGLLTAKLRLSDHQRKSPVSGSSSDVDRGKQIYQEQCSFCHGEPSGKPAMLANAFSPRPPQFLKSPPKRATWMNAYLIRHGIRWTAMPSFEHLSEADAWCVAMYLDTLKTKAHTDR